jgi:hypothetical protein
MLISAMAGEGSNNENIAISLLDEHHAMLPAQTKRNGTFHAFRAFHYLPDLMNTVPLPSLSHCLPLTLIGSSIKALV